MTLLSFLVSGRQDSNLRPPVPKTGALPGCATPPEELVGKTLIAITNLPPRKMMGIESCGMLLSAVNNLKDSEDEELHLLMVDNHIPAGAKLY